MKAFVSVSPHKTDAACAILIVDSNDAIIHKKILALQNTSGNRAELQGIQYATEIVDDAALPIEVGIQSQYVLSMLDEDKNGKWVRSPKKNQDLVEKLREWQQKGKILLVYGDGPIMEKAKWWAKAVNRLRDGVPAEVKSPLDF